jgi:hypothetical protein
MAPEIIEISSGEVVYLTGYREVARTNFPHHGDVILSGEREFRREFERQVRDFTCGDCTEAYRSYWKKRQK